MTRLAIMQARAILIGLTKLQDIVHTGTPATGDGNNKGIRPNPDPVMNLYPILTFRQCRCQSRLHLRVIE